MPNLNSCLLLDINMASEEEDEYSLEEKFYAAVKVMRTLPEEGPFQPSDDMMLMFYSYYKQATSGPCNIPRPTGFWDTRGKAKWDAWSALGNMTREEAMKNYLEDIQLILEAIPISNEVTDLVQKLGNFFTEVESNDEDMENRLDKMPFTRPFANENDVRAIIPALQGYGDLWDDIQNVPEIEKDCFAGESLDSVDSQGSRHSCGYIDCEEDISDDENKEETEEQAWTSDPRRLMAEDRRWSMEPSVSSFTVGTHSSLNSEAEEEELRCSVELLPQCNPYMHFNGHPCDLTVAAGKNVRSPDSDNEEFCDSMEHLAMDEGLPTSKGHSHESRSTSLRHCDSWFDSCSALNSPNESYVRDEMSTVQYTSAQSRRLTGTGFSCGSTFSPNVIAAHHCGSQRPPSRCRSRESTNEQIATALLRLQQDMDRVLYRLQTLEVLTVSQPPSPSANQYPLATAFQLIKPSWWPSQTSPVAVFFTVAWPVFAHWLVQLYLKRKRRRIT